MSDKKIDDTKLKMSIKKKILLAIGGLFTVLALAYVLLSIWYMQAYKPFPSQEEMKQMRENHTSY